MLGKLIKYEWKSISKLCSIMLGAMILTSLLGCIILRTPLVVELFRSSSSIAYTEMQQTALILMIMAGAVMYVLILMAATYGILIYMGVHFYKSMYTDEGYLTHTLPVTGQQLLTSKILVASIWQFITSIVVVLSVFTIMISVGISAAEAAGIWQTVDYNTLWGEICELFRDMFDVAGGAAVRMVVDILLMLLTSPIINICILFGSLTLGQLSGKHRLMLGIIAYIGSLIVYNMMGSVLQFVAMFANIQMYDGTGNAGATISIYESAVLLGSIISVGYYLLSRYIVTKKLNMD